MTKEERLLQYYNTIRAEINLHINLRDQALFIYLGGVAALFGVAFGTSVNTEILLIVPFLTLGITITVAQHDSHIGALAAHCVKDLGKAFSDLGITQWDDSETFHTYEKRLLSSRYWSHLLIMFLPAVAALGENLLYAYARPSVMGFIWYLGLVAMVVSYFWLRNVRIYRSDLQRDQKETKKGRPVQTDGQ